MNQSTTLNLIILSVQVIETRHGTDHINIKTNLPTVFPELKYETFIEIRARKGYGAEWVRNVLGVEPEIIKEIN